MNILIDIGNSRLKWAIAQNGQITQQSALDYRQINLQQQLIQLWQPLPIPRKLAIASVANPELKADIMALAQTLWSSVAIVNPTTTASALGVSNAYHAPEKLGIDRWLALLAAHHFYPGDSCIVDCGTAVTLDMLTATGIHLGGLIAPGLQLMKKSLSHNTAALPLAEQMPSVGLAQDTATAIQSGGVYALLGMIEIALQKHGSPCQLILCGGDAQTLQPQLQRPAIVDEALVLKGLALLVD